MYNSGVDYLHSQATVNDIQAALQPLSSYDNRALRELVEDDSKVEEHIKNLNLETRKTMGGNKEMIMAQNKSLAEYNLGLEPMLESGKNNLKQLMLQIEEVRASVLRKQQEVGKTSMSTETALALLQTSAAESEEDSEKFAELFYQKDIDVEDFLDKFQDSRKRMHLRRVKAEKMVELVSNQNSRPLSASVRRPAPLPPYPVGPNSFFNNHFVN